MRPERKLERLTTLLLIRGLNLKHDLCPLTLVFLSCRRVCFPLGPGSSQTAGRKDSWEDWV